MPYADPEKRRQHNAAWSRRRCEEMKRERAAASPDLSVEAARITPAERERFWGKVDRSGSGCWLFGAHVDHLGYGRFRSAALSSTGFLAHRYSWLLAHGAIPVGLDVCHKCDVRGCVNPAHLFLGTHTDNMQDMLRKGRGNKPAGERHHAAVLSEEQVREIRRRRLGGERGVDLAREFGVTPTAVWCIAKGRSWKHVA